jgi:kynureninase
MGAEDLAPTPGKRSPMTQESTEDDWSDVNFRSYTQFPAVADPDELELPEPFVTPVAPVPAAEAPESSAADDAG